MNGRGRTNSQAGQVRRELRVGRTLTMGRVVPRAVAPVMSRVGMLRRVRVVSGAHMGSRGAKPGRTAGERQAGTGSRPLLVSRVRRISNVRTTGRVPVGSRAWGDGPTFIMRRVVLRLRVGRGVLSRRVKSLRARLVGASRWEVTARPEGTSRRDMGGQVKGSGPAFKGSQAHTIRWELDVSRPRACLAGPGR